jgi:dsDNA-specific endonuclease/ATPase MutS2
MWETHAQEDSERLLQETGEALSAQLSLGGVQDIRAMLTAVNEGRSLHPLHLTTIASTLLAAKAIEKQIQLKCGCASRSHTAHPVVSWYTCHHGTTAQERLCCPSAWHTRQV